MPSNFTPNYNLNQWEADDRVLRTDFNADNAKLDAALGKKAEQSVVTALQTKVNAKAEQSALTALQAKVNAKAEQSALTALQNTVAEVSARAGSEVLADVTLTKETDEISLDLSRVNWDNFSVVVTYIDAPSDVQYDDPFTFGDYPRGPTATVFFPLRSREKMVVGIQLVQSSSYRTILKDYPFKKMSVCVYRIHLNGSQTKFPVGIRAGVVGIH